MRKIWLAILVVLTFVSYGWGQPVTGERALERSRLPAAASSAVSDSTTTRNASASPSQRPEMHLEAPVLPVATSPVHWIKSYAEGRKLARSGKRPVLLDFRADWCGPCRMMESKTFADPEIQALLGRFVCVQVDIDREPDVAMAWRISGIPRLVLLNVHDQVIGDNLGFIPSADLAPKLEEALAHADDKMAEDTMPHPDLGLDKKSLSDQLTQATGDALTSAVMELVLHSDPKARREGLEAVRPQAARLRPILEQLLGHERLAVRVGALEALEVFGAPTAFDPWAEGPQRTEAFSRFVRNPRPPLNAERPPTDTGTQPTK